MKCDICYWMVVQEKMRGEARHGKAESEKWYRCKEEGGTEVRVMT